MELDAEDIARFGNAIGRFEKVLENVSERRTNNVGTATITVNAGGVGLWIAATCCISMMVGMCVAGFWVSREFSSMDSSNHAQDNEISTMTDYLQAIYAKDPSLKPKEK